MCFPIRFLQIDKQQFEETIQTLNNLYAEAEKLGGKSYLEGCLACLTAYTVFLCMETHYEKVPFSCITLNSVTLNRLKSISIIKSDYGCKIWIVVIFIL